VLVACVALLAAPTAGASTWSGLAPLDPEGTSPSDAPVPLATNASGLTITGWLSRAYAGGGANGGVRIIERPPGGAWGARQTIKPPDNALSTDIELALADDGFGVAAWSNVDMSSLSTIAYSARSTAGVWGPVVPLVGGNDPQVALQPDGRAVVAWSGGATVTAVVIAKNGVASAPLTVYTAPTGAIDGVDLTTAGGVTPTVASILWHDNTNALHVVVRGISFDGTPSSTPYYCGFSQGDFDPPPAALTGAAPSFVSGSAAVVADTVGGVVTGFGIVADGGSTRRIVLARCQPTIAGWEQVVMPAGQFPTVALALQAGRVVAAWGAPTGLAVTERDLRNGSGWSPTSIPITFASTDATDTAQLRSAVAFDSAGDAVVATDFLRAGQLVFTSAHRLAGGAWTADSIDAQPADALASPYTPGLVSQRRGGFIATWRNPLSDRYPRTGDLDVEPPQITVSGLAATVTGGQAVTASAAVTDNWSGFVPTSVRWDFGDGTTATGASVTHTFVASGPKTVVVTALDGANNLGKTTIAINVAAPTIALSKVNLLAPRWKASRLTGKLLVKFTPPPASALRIAITSADGKKTYRDQVVPPGKTEVTLTLPPRLLPGRYLVRLGGTSGGAAIAAATAPFSVPRPKEGVVSFAYLTSRKNGQPRTVIAGFQTSLYAYVTFASPPRGAVQVKWFGPKGERGATSGPYRNKRLEFYVRQPRGLSRGTWRAQVLSKGRIAYQLKIKIA
jgi:PKD repeat protein